jgi:ABC-type sugar transport system ATPase subunit
MAWLSVQEVEKTIASRKVLLPTSMEAEQFQKIAIAGETGAGKSTLVKMIGGILQADKGQIYFEGKRVLGPDEQLLPGHKGIAYLSQHFELHNNYLVEEQIDYGNELPAHELRQLVEVCQIGHLMKRKTNSGLSGGERQRIVLAKLLATKPKLLLLDEPFSNLDAPHKQIIREVIHDMGQRLGISIIMVSHDAGDMLSWADRIIVMQDGQIVQQDGPQNIYNNPASPYVAGLFGAFNLLDKNMALSLGLVNADTGHHWLSRPEDFYITSNRENSIECVVRSIQYFGSYWMVTVQHGDEHLRIRCNELRVETGLIVSVAMHTGKAHLISSTNA